MTSNAVICGMVTELELEEELRDDIEDPEELLDEFRTDELEDELDNNSCMTAKSRLEIVPSANDIWIFLDGREIHALASMSHAACPIHAESDV